MRCVCPVAGTDNPGRVATQRPLGGFESSRTHSGGRAPDRAEGDGGDADECLRSTRVLALASPNVLDPRCQARLIRGHTCKAWSALRNEHRPSPHWVVWQL